MAPMRLTKVVKRKETKMIRYLEVTLTSLAKVVKRVKINMIRYLEMALYQSHKSREKKRFTKISYSPSVYISIFFDSLSLLLNHIVHFAYKRGGKKEADFIFVHQPVRLWIPQTYNEDKHTPKRSQVPYPWQPFLLVGGVLTIFLLLGIEKWKNSFHFLINKEISASQTRLPDLSIIL